MVVAVVAVVNYSVAVSLVEMEYRSRYSLLESFSFGDVESHFHWRYTRYAQVETVLLADIHTQMEDLSLADTRPSSAVIRRNTAATRRDSSYKIDPRSGGLVCDMECMIIGSFGDEQAPGVRAVRKSKPIGSFLPGVREDVDKIQTLIKKDPSKILAYSVVDFPGERCLCPKGDYLEKIEVFLQDCESPGGETFF